jgi:hypothetical protein
MTAQIKTFPAQRIKRLVADNTPTALYISLLIANMPDEEFGKLADAIVAASGSDMDSDALIRGMAAANVFVEE